MRSPKFASRQTDLAAIFAITNLKATWRNKVRDKLRDRYIPDPVENLDFHIHLESRCREIAKLVSEGRYQSKPALRITMEKSKGLCRQIVLPSVSDAVVLQRLSDALYANIRGKAPTKNAFFEPDDNRFSQAAKDANGVPTYGGLRAWLNFQKALFDFSETRNYIIVTDIANYYDCISYAHLRNVIASQIDVKESILDTLIFVLSGLLWQPDYMPRIEVGLPQIDFDASRILAHCLLYELDEFLASIKNVDFVRYMDDIDVGTDSLLQARSLVRDIDLVLQTRQLRLNSGKTLILTRAEALSHFKSRENYRVDLVLRALNRKIAKSLSTRRERRYVSRLIAKMSENHSFDSGNGEKILKRLLTLATRTNAYIAPQFVISTFYNRPAVRGVTLKYIFSKRGTLRRVRAAHAFVRSGYLVDDVGYLSTVTSLMEAHAFRTAEIDKLIAEIVDDLQNKSSYALFSAIWLASRYFDTKALLKLLIDTLPLWRGDMWLGRTIGGLRPIFVNASELEKFERIISSTKNESLDHLYDFHRWLSTEAEAIQALKKFISAPNKSRPLKITHAKFLMLLSLLQNPHLPKSEGARLLSVFETAFSDPYYRRAASFVLPAVLLPVAL